MHRSPIRSSDELRQRVLKCIQELDNSEIRIALNMLYTQVSKYSQSNVRHFGNLSWVFYIFIVFCYIYINNYLHFMWISLFSVLNIRNFIHLQNSANLLSLATVIDNQLNHIEFVGTSFCSSFVYLNISNWIFGIFHYNSIIC